MLALVSSAVFKATETENSATQSFANNRHFLAKFSLDVDHLPLISFNARDIAEGKNKYEFVTIWL